MTKKPTTMSRRQTAMAEHKSHCYVETLTGPEDAWLTVSEAIQVSRRPEGTIRYWICEGKLPTSNPSHDHHLQVRLSDLRKLTKIVESHLPLSTEPEQSQLGDETVQQQHMGDSQNEQSLMLQVKTFHKPDGGTPVSTSVVPPIPASQCLQLPSVLEELMAKQEQLLAVQQQSDETAQAQLTQATEMLKQHMLRQQETINTNQIELLTQQKFQCETLQEISGMVNTVVEQCAAFALTFNQTLREVKAMLQEQRLDLESLQQSIQELSLSPQKHGSSKRS